MTKIIGIGETIMDLVFKNNTIEKIVPGGSVFNALVSLARSNENVLFVSETGNNIIGEKIIKFMTENNMNTEFITRYEETPTPLSLAFLNEKNDAEYVFYKQQPQNIDYLPLPTINPHDILLYGSFYTINSKTRPRVTSLIEEAKKKNILRYYDPNFRSSHLKELPDLLPKIIETMKNSSIVRGSDEDFRLIFSSNEDLDALYEKTIKHISPYFICTCAENGVFLFSPNLKKHFPTPKIQPISTIGAGDNFNAGFIFAYSQMLKENKNLKIKDLTEKEWEKLIRSGINFSKEVCLSLNNYIDKK
jgi:fructokinase